uniref:Uncharacterized protein n=2 Tax=Aegilops tauschii subsp. strangulata TaxID=200361 RepID=A0A453QPZ9_AEGTS
KTGGKNPPQRWQFSPRAPEEASSSEDLRPPLRSRRAINPAVVHPAAERRFAMAAAESFGLRRGAGARARRKAKEAAVGAAARALFYPTLLYNVVRSKVQAEFRWWDEVDQFILLGAVPFRRDVTRLQKLGVHGVVTLNEPFETLVPTSVYKETHLVEG